LLRIGAQIAECLLKVVSCRCARASVAWVVLRRSLAQRSLSVTSPLCLDERDSLAGCTGAVFRLALVAVQGGCSAITPASARMPGWIHSLDTPWVQVPILCQQRVLRGAARVGWQGPAFVQKLVRAAGILARETDDGCVLPQQDLSQEKGNGSDVLAAGKSGNTAECVHG